MTETQISDLVSKILAEIHSAEDFSQHEMAITNLIREALASSDLRKLIPNDHC